MALRDQIIASANALGVNPLDLATAISYETAGTFDPLKRGPVTQHGQHRGLIQFGEPQARRYGVDWDDPIGSQLGENGAVVKYMRDAGVQPGMGMLDIYSAINAGRVGRYNASDANNGGAPGTVRDKVNTQMAGHRAKAARLLGSDWSPASAGTVMGGTVELPGQVPAPLFFADAPAALAGSSMNPFDLIIPSAYADEAPPVVNASAQRAPAQLSPDMQTLAQQIGRNAAVAQTPLTAAQRASRDIGGGGGLTRSSVNPTAVTPPNAPGLLSPSQQNLASVIGAGAVQPNAAPAGDPFVDYSSNPQLSIGAGVDFVDQTPKRKLSLEDITYKPDIAMPVLTGEVNTHTAPDFPAPAGTGGGPIGGGAGSGYGGNPDGDFRLPSGANAPTPEMSPNYFPPAPKAPSGFNMGNFLSALGSVAAALDQGSPELKPVSLSGYAHKPENVQLPIPKGLLG